MLVNMNAQVSVLSLCGSSATVLSRRSVVSVTPRGSHGQETDQPTGTQFTLSLVCVAASRSIAKPTAPRGSHGQETDLPVARS
jgi:hypothetical protein